MKEKTKLMEKFILICRYIILNIFIGILTGSLFLGVVAFFLGIIVPVLDWMQTGYFENINLFVLTGLSSYTKFTSWVGINKIISGFFELNVFIASLFTIVIVGSISIFILRRIGPWN